MTIIENSMKIGGKDFPRRGTGHSGLRTTVRDGAPGGAAGSFYGKPSKNQWKRVASDPPRRGLSIPTRELLTEKMPATRVS